MWRVTFDKVRDPLLMRELIDYGVANGCTPRVEELAVSQPGTDERLSSSSWLVDQIMIKLVESMFFTKLTRDDVRERLRESTLAAIAGLTLENFLLGEPWFLDEILEIMAENQVKFADGADPQTFPGSNFQRGEPSKNTHYKLGRFGVTSWAMLPFVSAATLINEIRQFNKGRVGEIRTALIARGLPPLKGE